MEPGFHEHQLEQGSSMQQFGPIFSPANVATTAIDNPEAALGKQVVNSAVSAIQEAINPTPEQQAERERAQKQEAEAREKREKAEDQQALQQQQDLQRMRLDAQLIDEAVEPDTRPEFISKAEVIGRLDQNVDDGVVGIDAQGVEMAAERQRVLQRLDTAGIEMNVPGLDGHVPEVAFGVFANAGVIRLEQVGQERQQNDRFDLNTADTTERDRNIRTLEDGSKLMYARLTFKDGSQVTIDLVFRPEEALDDRGTYAGKPEAARRREDEYLSAA
jgi:hypothetical protein